MNGLKLLVSLKALEQNEGNQKNNRVNPFCFYALSLVNCLPSLSGDDELPNIRVLCKKVTLFNFTQYLFLLVIYHQRFKANFGNENKLHMSKDKVEVLKPAMSSASIQTPTTLQYNFPLLFTSNGIIVIKDEAHVNLKFYYSGYVFNTLPTQKLKSLLPRKKFCTESSNTFNYCCYAFRNPQLFGTFELEN